jgi:hypothetical protein
MLAGLLLVAVAPGPDAPDGDTAAGREKSPKNPVLGGHLGT